MSRDICLDSTPLGLLCHPTRNGDISLWLELHLEAGSRVYLPEIVDYELRRALLAANMTRSLRRLDAFKTSLDFVPLNSAALLDAAQLWATLRKQGLSTASAKELDGDAILAAQARQVNALVATENVRHLSRMCAAQRWSDIAP